MSSVKFVRSQCFSSVNIVRVPHYLSVGKTSLLLRQTGNAFTKNLTPTLGAAFCVSRIQVSGDDIVSLQIWDTAGQERFRAMAPMYYRGAHAAVIVYDVTDMQSFDQAKVWHNDLKSHSDTVNVICLVGNKNDLEMHRQVPTATGAQYAEKVGAMFIETSAVTGDGVSSVFRWIASELHANRENIVNSSLGLSLNGRVDDDANVEQRQSCCSG